MTQLTYSNKSNAIRGFRQAFPAIASTLDNDSLRARGLVDGCSIDLEAVAEYQAERLGVVTYNRLLGVPMLRRSVDASRPVSRARQLYASLPAGTPRRDAIAAAVDAGIAFYTARTQYQAFRRAVA
jgi:hypothetical protein